MSKNLVKTAWHMARSIAYCTCEKDDFPCIVHAYPAWEVWLEACCIKPQKDKDGNQFDLEVGFTPIVAVALATAGMPSIVHSAHQETQVFWSLPPGSHEPRIRVALSHRTSELGWRIQLKQAQVESLVRRYADCPDFELPASFIAEVGAGEASKKAMDESSLPKPATQPESPRPKQRPRKKRNCRPGASSQSRKQSQDRSAATTLRVRTKNVSSKRSR